MERWGVSTLVTFSPVSKVGVIVLANLEDDELEEIMYREYELGKNRKGRFERNDN